MPARSKDVVDGLLAQEKVAREAEERPRIDSARAAEMRAQFIRDLRAISKRLQTQARAAQREAHGKFSPAMNVALDEARKAYDQAAGLARAKYVAAIADAVRPFNAQVEAVEAKLRRAEALRDAAQREADAEYRRAHLLPE